MTGWSYSSYTWFSCTDAVTGLVLTFNAAHVVAVRGHKGGQSHILTSAGLDYHVKESRLAILAALTGKSEGEL